jgi:hypothetical protein
VFPSYQESRLRRVYSFVSRYIRSSLIIRGLLLLFYVSFYVLGLTNRARVDIAGFITMTPQLFINYKLKSVAHLPWRMLTYKALNTFIDDLFAFVIKMPMLYRLGCFRDG